MPTLTSTDADILMKTLDTQVKAGSWRALLELFAYTGVVDMIQIQDSLSLVRDKARGLLDQVIASRGTMPLIIEKLEQDTQRAGARGRKPTIYRLGSSGAALLRHLGYKNVQATRLIDELAVQHAVLMLDVRLAATRSGLSVVTDRGIQYGDNRYLRPDNQITLSDGRIAFFETEQSAQTTHIRRITESIQNKLAFFSSKGIGKTSPDVRMLVNVVRGPDWDRTIKIWRQCYEVIAQEHTMPFRILAMPAMEFMTNPDWAANPDMNRWHDITAKPSQALIPMPKKNSAPAWLLKQTPEEDRLVLNALCQQFLENGETPIEAAAFPNPVFFETMRLIYTASHDEDIKGGLLWHAASPWASIYLLNQYFMMHPDLKNILHQTIVRGASSVHWGTTTILHKMQLVIDCFMRYHGWRNGRVLRYIAGMYDYDSIVSAGFGISVRIWEPELLMLPGQLVVPSKADVKQAEEALSWVLLALFAHAERLGLPVCSFW